jgi:hypothetical protein
MWYELWNQSSGNLIGEFGTEDEALAEIRWMIEQSGRDAVASWRLAMGRGDEAGADEPVLIGDDLLDRAMRTQTTA